MPVQRLPRPLVVLASVLAAAGSMLALASCSHIAPIGPGTNPPQQHRLRSPFVLEAMRAQPNIAFPSGNQARQLYRTLVPAG